MWILSTIMFPPVVAVIPIFIMAGRLQLIDRYLTLIVPYAAFNLPLVIWVLRSSIRQIPEDRGRRTRRRRLTHGDHHPDRAALPRRASRLRAS